MHLFLVSSSHSCSPPLGNFNRLCLDPKSFTWMRVCTTSLCNWPSSWHIVTKWQELLCFKNLTLWTNDVDGHIHHESKRDTKDNVPYFVFRLDSEVLNGINFRARELSTSQVRLPFLLAFSTYWIQIFWQLVQETIQKENFFFNDDCDMSNEDVEDQDVEELSTEDEIAKNKNKIPSVLCLLCYFMIVIFRISH